MKQLMASVFQQKWLQKALINWQKITYILSCKGHKQPSRCALITKCSEKIQKT